MTAGHRRHLDSLAPEAAGRTVLMRTAAWKARSMNRQELPFETWVTRLASDVPEAERPRLDVSNDIPDPIGGPLRIPPSAMRSPPS